MIFSMLYKTLTLDCRKIIMSCPTCGTFYKPDYFDPVKDEACSMCIALIAVQESEEKVKHLLECSDSSNKLDYELNRQIELKNNLDRERERSIGYDITSLHEEKHERHEEKFSSLEILKINCIDLLLSMGQHSYRKEIEKVAELTTAQGIALVTEQAMLKSRISSLKTIFSHSPKVHERIDTIQNAVQLETLMQELQVA